MRKPHLAFCSKFKTQDFRQTGLFQITQPVHCMAFPTNRCVLIKGYVCMVTYICVNIYIYTYDYVYIYIYRCIHKYTYIYKCTNVEITFYIEYILYRLPLPPSHCNANYIPTRFIFLGDFSIPPKLFFCSYLQVAIIWTLASSGLRATGREQRRGVRATLRTEGKWLERCALSLQLRGAA